MPEVQQRIVQQLNADALSMFDGFVRTLTAGPNGTRHHRKRRQIEDDDSV